MKLTGLNRFTRWKQRLLKPVQGPSKPAGSLMTHSCNLDIDSYKLLLALNFKENLSFFSAWLLLFFFNHTRRYLIKFFFTVFNLACRALGGSTDVMELSPPLTVSR